MERSRTLLFTAFIRFYAILFFEKKTGSEKFSIINQCTYNTQFILYGLLDYLIFEFILLVRI